MIFGEVGKSTSVDSTSIWPVRLKWSFVASEPVDGAPAITPPPVDVTLITPSYFSHATLVAHEVGVALQAADVDSAPSMSASTGTAAGSGAVPVFTIVIVPPDAGSTSVSVLPLRSPPEPMSANSDFTPPVIVTTSWLR